MFYITRALVTQISLLRITRSLVTNLWQSVTAVVITRMRVVCNQIFGYILGELQVTKSAISGVMSNEC